MGVFIGYNFLIGCFSRMSYKSCTRKLCDHRTWFYHFILNTAKIIKQSLDIMTLLSAYINFTLVSIHLLSIRNQIESVSDCCLMPTQQFFSKFSIWWWGQLCTRPTRSVGFSLKQQSCWYTCHPTRAHYPDPEPTNFCSFSLRLCA